MPEWRRGDSLAGNGTVRSRTCPIICMMMRLRAFWLRRNTTAYIKIAEGCDHPCTFCIIPQLRGQFRSRRFESVIAEAERLAHAGVREITLIGQDTTCYGEDFGLKDGLACCLRSWQRLRTCAGSGSSMRIQTRSRANCWRRSARQKRFVLTWTCRCSMHRRRC